MKIDVDCPLCKLPMRTTDHKEDGGKIVIVCPECGYLDRLWITPEHINKFSDGGTNARNNNNG